MDSILRCKATLPTKCPHIGSSVLSCFGCVRLSVTPWSVVHQEPLYVGFSRHKYWSGFSCPPPGGLPKPEIKAVFLVSCIGWWVFLFFIFTTSATWEALTW